MRIGKEIESEGVHDDDERHTIRTWKREQARRPELTEEEDVKKKISHYALSLSIFFVSSSSSEPIKPSSSNSSASRIVSDGVLAWPFGRVTLLELRRRLEIRARERDRDR